jgi:hypothetical protein
MILLPQTRPFRARSSTVEDKISFPILQVTFDTLQCCPLLNSKTSPGWQLEWLSPPLPAVNFTRMRLSCRVLGRDQLSVAGTPKLRASALLILALWAASAAAQSVTLNLTVTDENGIAVPSARVLLAVPNSPILHCETDFAGRCRFLLPASVTCQLRVEKEGFYALVQPTVQVTQNSTLDITLSHQQEIREIVDVIESPPAIDPAQVSSQQTLSGLYVLNIIPRPTTIATSSTSSPVSCPTSTASPTSPADKPIKQ